MQFEESRNGVTRQRPTILQIIPRLDTGGAERSTVEIVAALVRAGARAIVATQGGRLAAEVEAAGGTIVPFPAATKNPVRLLANARMLRRLIAAEAVDLVHARSRAPAWSALLAARRAGVPFVTTYHGAYAEKGGAKRLYNSVMARGDRVIANSAFTASLVRERYGTPEERIRIIHRGVDPVRFDPERVARERIEALRGAWDVASGQPVILQAARLTSWKGQRVLIESLALLRRQGRLGPAVAVLAGDAQGRDDYARALREDADRLGVADAVRLPGHVQDMAAAFRLAHVTVIASVEPEAFGRTATESQAMGCPVIATAIGAPPETVLDAGQVGPGAATGWLVPPGDAATLAERLAQALALTSGERDALSARARAHVTGHLTVGAMQSATLAVYDELIGSGLAGRLAAAPVPQPT